MAVEGVKISELAEKTTLSGTEYLPVQDGEDNKKMKTDLFQKKLVSGTDIKTFNGESLLGNGNIIVDDTLDKGSNNAVRNSVVATKIAELEDAVFPLTISVSGGGTFEKGTVQRVTVSWSVRKGGVAVKAESVTVNGSPVSGGASSYMDMNVSADKTYMVKAVYQGKTVSGSTTARFVAPMYFGFASRESVADGLDIESLTKQALKTSPGGTYTLENGTKGYYMWLCVPSSMSIGKVTSSGFDVPMLEAEEGSTEVDSYRCYRSASGIDEGSFTIVVS